LLALVKKNEDLFNCGIFHVFFAFRLITVLALEIAVIRYD